MKKKRLERNKREYFLGKRDDKWNKIGTTTTTTTINNNNNKRKSFKTHFILTTFPPKQKGLLSVVSNCILIV